MRTSRFATLILGMGLTLFAPSPARAQARKQTYRLESSLSSRLTEYLHSHGMPLVEARVSTDDYGNRRALLYGFVGDVMERIDAETDTLDFFGDPLLEIQNTIQVREQLRATSSNPLARRGRTGVFDDDNLGTLEDYKQEAALDRAAKAAVGSLPVIIAPGLGGQVVIPRHLGSGRIIGPRNLPGYRYYAAPYLGRVTGGPHLGFGKSIFSRGSGLGIGRSGIPGGAGIGGIGSGVGGIGSGGGFSGGFGTSGAGLR